MKKFIALSILCFTAGLCAAQVTQQKFSRADSLRGYLSPLRSCYDVTYYHLDVKVDIDNKSISGSNLMRFRATGDFKRLQFDLAKNLDVQKVVYNGKDLPFTREFTAVFVDFPAMVTKGSTGDMKIYYGGKPKESRRAPWDAGFVFTKDSLGKDFVATACQGEGAHVWWPNKDHQSDEPDSMLISVSVPKGLKNISNGRLRKTTKLADGYTRFDWFVGNPINNYDVAINIADYVHFSDSYDGEKGKLTLDYWVLPQHLEKAKKQFGANVKPMLKAFEYWFGPYPFYSDGFKLIETPHLGMEHQSGIAYGNKYMNGYLGRDLSGTGTGLNWDYIVIHEAGHEWFGNNITASDIADMWIQEGFTTYSEGLFVEQMQGKEAGAIYINGSRRNINNDGPIAGAYHVNNEGSGDMYPKIAAVLHMMRTIVNDDAKWREVLRGLGREFYHQTILRPELISYINKTSGKDFTKVFDQYLLYKNIPVLEVRFQNGKAYGKWISDVNGFAMPIRLGIKGQEMKFFEADSRMKEIPIQGLTKDNIQVDTFNFYVGVLVQ